MANPDPRTPKSGGFLLAMSVLVGVVAGAAYGQPSLGFVAGLAVGIALVLGVWLWDRRG